MMIGVNLILDLKRSCWKGLGLESWKCTASAVTRARMMAIPCASEIVFDGLCLLCFKADVGAH